jgi:hypothetical protein
VDAHGPASEGGRQQKIGAPQDALARLTARRERCVQRVEMYIVISKPKRVSMACGVSHFMVRYLGSDGARPWKAANLEGFTGRDRFPCATESGRVRRDAHRGSPD